MYLIIGANGFLGSYIIKNILELTTDEVIAVARNIENLETNQRVEWLSCDISNQNEVDKLYDNCRAYKDLKVVYLAAYHNPDLVEKNPKIAWHINITSLSYFINKFDNVSKLYYPSSDSVYGNTEGTYRFKEEDELKPVNTYGKQKALAEKVVTEYGYNVVRYPFLISPSLAPNKKHFYDHIVNTIKNGEKMEMFADSYRSTISFDTASELLVQLIESAKEIPSVLNVCGDNDLSKYDVGLMIAEKLGVNIDLIVPVTTELDSSIFEAVRAKSTLMDNSKLKEVMGLTEINLSL